MARWGSWSSWVPFLPQLWVTSPVQLVLGRGGLRA